ncbi:MAG: hypothetical protein V5A54_13570 [Haloarculaceae archaeon]
MSDRDSRGSAIDDPGRGDPPDMGDLIDELEELEGLVRTEAAREQVRESIRMALETQDDAVFGLVPRRLVGVMSVPLLTALFMMTVWGRVDWADPWLSLCTVSVAFVPMAIGAALGDILPGS